MRMCLHTHSQISRILPLICLFFFDSNGIYMTMTFAVVYYQTIDEQQSKFISELCCINKIEKYFHFIFNNREAHINPNRFWWTSHFFQSLIIKFAVVQAGKININIFVVRCIYRVDIIISVPSMKWASRFIIKDSNCISLIVTNETHGHWTIFCLLIRMKKKNDCSFAFNVF